MVPIDYQASRMWWDQLAEVEDARDQAPRKCLHTALLWREIGRHLSGVRTILDAGGGSGRFSIPLADQGYEVTHLDLSPAMLSVAQRKAETRSLTTITFLEGNITDLGRFADRSFDLVLCLDHPVTLCGSDHRRAVAELSRVTRSCLILSVMNRAGTLPHYINSEVRCCNELGRPAVLTTSLAMWTDGDFTCSPEVCEIEQRTGRAAGYPFSHSFTPGELVGQLATCGLKAVTVSAIGSLIRLVEEDVLDTIIASKKVLDEFLELADEYDRCPDVLGLGALTDSGLLVTARRM